MKKRLFVLIIALVIAFSTVAVPIQAITPNTITESFTTDSVSTPKSVKSSGTYYSDGSIKIPLSCSTKGATIYYSINGSKYKKYTGSIVLTKNTVIKIYAAKGGKKSKIATYKYYLYPRVTISPESGKYTEPQVVKLSSSVSGVRYYYTLDGTKPTTSSARYSADGIKISDTSELRILAVKKDWKNRYITKDYTINNKDSSDSPGILDNYTEKYGYSLLTKAQKKAYAALFEAVKSGSGKADVYDAGVYVDEVDKIYWAFDYDNPQFFRLGNAYEYTYSAGKRLLTISVKWGRTKSQANKIQSEFEATSDKIIQKALKEKSDFDRVKVLHDEIIKLTRYCDDGSLYQSEADGPLVYGKAVCEGYSKAFAYLAQSIGIDCICCSNQNHMWNMVKIEGNWYHIDVTWDDPVGSRDYLKYDYFLLSESEISTDHSGDYILPIPKATTHYIR